jgi:enoyl-CoA hydratase/carnithine racemase
LTGERFGPDVALRIGLVGEVAADVVAATDAAVGEILSAGPTAVREAKRLVRADPGDGRELAELAARMRTSEEGQAGLRAFLDKQPAPWRSESS